MAKREYTGRLGILKAVDCKDSRSKMYPGGFYEVYAIDGSTPEGTCDGVIHRQWDGNKYLGWTIGYGHNFATLQAALNRLEEDMGDLILARTSRKVAQ